MRLMWLISIKSDQSLRSSIKTVVFHLLPSSLFYTFYSRPQCRLGIFLCWWCFPIILACVRLDSPYFVPIKLFDRCYCWYSQLCSRFLNPIVYFTWNINKYSQIYLPNWCLNRKFALFVCRRILIRKAQLLPVRLRGFILNCNLTSREQILSDELKERWIFSRIGKFHLKIRFLLGSIKIFTAIIICNFSRFQLLRECLIC